MSKIARVVAYVILLCSGYAVVTAYPVFAQTPQRQSTTRPPSTTAPNADSARADTVKHDSIAGVVVHQDTLHADTIVSDTAHVDSLRRASAKHDTTKVRADSIQARFGRDHAPTALEVGQSYKWTRDDYFASGSLTVLDLLRHIPGVTNFQTLWLPSPEFASYNGDLGRIRVFYDGVELDNLESRNGSLLDLSTVQLWTLESVTVTRGANDLRIDIRSWQYDNTRPYTRIDGLTGDYNTNMYRAFYGKRFYNGAGLQIGADQYNVTSDAYGGGGDHQSLFGRYGIARQFWSVDATVLRTRTTRTITQRFDGGPAMANYRSENTLAYLRAAVGHEGNGPFLQFVASSEGLKENSSHFDSLAAGQYGFPPDTVDSTSSISQYVTTVGFDKWGGSIRVIDRYRTQRGSGYNDLGATFDLTKSLLSLSALAERDDYYGLTRMEVGARFSPISFFALSGYLGQEVAEANRTDQPTSNSAHIEAGLRVPGTELWISGGLMTRDTAVLVAPVVFDSSFRTQAIGRTTGTTLSIRGPVKDGISLDGWAAYWGTANSYTPEYEAYGELRFYTEWLSKFPNGNFSFLIAPSLEYRSPVAFPTSQGDRLSSAANVYSLQVELRILRGVITFQRRNLAQAIYDLVPGYLMPRAVTLYGIRWYFFN